MFEIHIVPKRGVKGGLLMNGLIRYLNKVKIVVGIRSHIGLFLFSVGDNGLKLADVYGNETETM